MVHEEQRCPSLVDDGVEHFAEIMQELPKHRIEQTFLRGDETRKEKGGQG